MAQFNFPTSFQLTDSAVCHHVNKCSVFTFAIISTEILFPTYQISISGTQLITIFEVTPLLPTYLFGLVISDFAFSTKGVDGFPFTVFSRSEQVTNTLFGLETGIKALKLFESAFETEYESGKLDQVALPGFSRGSMENHGIIFYHEDVLLVRPGVSYLRTWSYRLECKPLNKVIHDELRPL